MKTPLPASAGCRTQSAEPVIRPMKAMIEIVRACNLHCPLCPVGNGSAKRFPNMSRSTFINIINAIASSVRHLSLYNYGEPLLHPEVVDFVAIAKTAGIELVEITTNGTFVPSGLPAALVESGLDCLRFSIDGASQDSYGSYRVGGSLEAVFINLGKFRDAKQRLTLKAPLIEAQMIVNRFNEGEMDIFAQEAKKWGADAIRFKTFNARMSGSEYTEAGRSFLPAEPLLSRYLEYDDLTLRESSEPSDCRWPRERLVINADGSIVPCCYDFNAEHRLGSAENIDAEWWLTPERIQFRERLASNPSSIKMCSSCPLGARTLKVRNGVQNGIHEVGAKDGPV